MFLAISSTKYRNKQCVRIHSLEHIIITISWVSTRVNPKTTGKYQWNNIELVSSVAPDSWHQTTKLSSSAMLTKLIFFRAILILWESLESFSTQVGCIIAHNAQSFLTHVSVNPSPLRASYMRKWIGSKWVQIMSCCLFGAKPLFKLLLGYSQLDASLKF